MGKRWEKCKDVGYKNLSRAVNLGLVPALVLYGSFKTLDFLINGGVVEDPLSLTERLSFYVPTVILATSAFSLFSKVMTYPVLEIEGKATSAEPKHILAPKYFDGS